MAEGNGAIYNDFKEQLLKGTHDLSADSIKIILVAGYTPDIDAHAVYADMAAYEYTTASGYTAGGSALAGGTVVQDNSNDRGTFDATDLTWSSLGPLGTATPSHCVLYNDTPVSPADPLICYWELGTTATNGGDYTLQWGAPLMTLT